MCLFFMWLCYVANHIFFHKIFVQFLKLKIGRYLKITKLQSAILTRTQAIKYDKLSHKNQSCSSVNTHFFAPIFTSCFKKLFNLWRVEKITAQKLF